MNVNKSMKKYATNKKYDLTMVKKFYFNIIITIDFYIYNTKSKIKKFIL